MDWIWCCVISFNTHYDYSRLHVSFNDNDNHYDCIALVIEEWIWSIGGMILTWKNWCTWRKSYRSATLSTINPKWIGLELNPDLCNDRPTINSLSHGMTKCFKFPLKDVPLWNRTFTKSGIVYKTSYSYIINFR